MTLLAKTGEFNGLAVAVFGVVLAVTLVITRWAAKRTHSDTEFYAAGRGVAGAANGVATAGDYLSASTFLGYAGLMYLYGFDGWIIGAIVLWLVATGLGQSVQRRLASGETSAIASMHWIRTLVIVGLLVLMIWKPGA